MLQKNWVYKEIDENEVDRLVNCTGIPRALAKVFTNRGMLDGRQVKEFLGPDIGNMHDPFLMDGMEAAAGRILQAIETSEPILVYGDYDVDGVSGTSILYNFLKSRKANVQYFIPDRMEDGYGLTVSSAEKVKELKASLMITVDCGITSVDEVKSLQDSGMTVIVTDHHECKEQLPDAAAILNPHKPGCNYPFQELAGAGVALKLVHALCIRLGCSNEFMKYIDLAALATIADMVPLRGENRIIASFGLKAMETAPNLGLGALIKVAGYGDKPVNSYGVAFGLAPRVNAAGRIGSAIRSVRLFTSDSLVLAEALAKELDSENKIRQDTENEIIVEALSFVEEHLDPINEKVLVISGEGWHHGVIGIVASKVLEKYNRPCIVISVEDGIGKGSGRSITGFNLFQALNGCEDLLDRFGGHEMAAGLTIRADRIDELRKRLNSHADAVLKEVDLLPCVRVDAFLENDDLTLDNARELAKLAPFGLGNAAPVFGFTGAVIREIKTLSLGKHLKLRLSDYITGTSARKLDIEGIGFNMGELAGSFEAEDVIDAIFSLEINSWNGTERLQLNLKDFKTCIFAALDKNVVFNATNDYNRYVDKLLEFYSLQGYCHLKTADLIPGRNELEAVYRHIRAAGRAQLQGGGAETRRNGILFDDLFNVSVQLSEKNNITINYFKLKKSLEIFEELGLLSLEPFGRKGTIVCLAESVEKVDLESSRLLMELQSLNIVV